MDNITIGNNDNLIIGNYYHDITIGNNDNLIIGNNDITIDNNDNINIGNIGDDNGAIRIGHYIGHELVFNRPTNIGIGPNAGTSFEYNKHCTCMGHESDSIADGAVTVGSYAKSEHKNAIVIGFETKSVSENSVTLNDNIFTEGKLLIVDKFCLIGNNNIPDIFTCFSCNDNIISGIKWLQDEEDNLTMSLCFNCIFDTIMQNKAKEQWIKHLGYDPMSKLMNDVAKLQNEVTKLQSVIANTSV